MSMKRELRFVVTQRCIYECSFCHGEGLQTVKRDALSIEDFRFIFNVARSQFGFDYTTLSGGEPLVRSDIVEIAAGLYYDSGKTTLTTNGFFLDEKLYIGNYIKRLNVSIHSFNRDVYESIVGRSNVFHRVIYGLKKFRSKYPEVEIRLNTTVVRGLNSGEKDIDDLLKFASRLGASIKFVELYPSSCSGFFPIKEVEIMLMQRGFKQFISPTRKRDYSDGVIEVGLTKIFCAAAADSEIPSRFCNENNDLFVSPDGMLKPCRHNLMEVDILPEVRERDAEKLFLKLKKAFELLGKNCVATGTNMVQRDSSI